MRTIEEMSTERTSSPATLGRRVHRGICLAAIAFTAVGLATAPGAAANTSDLLRSALTASRGTACGPLRDDPVVEQAAEKINDGINSYTDHNARFVPEKDAMPLLKDLGYGGSKATMLFGAGKTDALAIKGLLLSGYNKIPDCSYTDYGLNSQYNESHGVILVIVVLAA